ncbi:hypothetical protein SVIO_091840 [Streptomyces violaceusniger]|uniref:Uncharacterized protein n=1 Tax=Streptomyces violaceusniger TaxID=68280 RepID=A0A4D4LAH4_STRVO|nr:hypothetical protein SVIO_091840 [Streptomyces violaceusniger]
MDDPQPRAQLAFDVVTHCSLQTGQPGEVPASVMHRTIDAVDLTRGGGGLNLAFSAGRELRQWRNEPWAQEINERLLALMAI